MTLSRTGLGICFLAVYCIALQLIATTPSAADWPQADAVFPDAQWPHPQITDENYLTWSKFVWPTEKELAWQKVRWHVELADAQEEARRLQRPILLWTMNGHPCGET